MIGVIRSNKYLRHRVNFLQSSQICVKHVHLGKETLKSPSQVHGSGGVSRLPAAGRWGHAGLFSPDTPKTKAFSLKTGRKRAEPPPSLCSDPGGELRGQTASSCCFRASCRLMVVRCPGGGLARTRGGINGEMNYHVQIEAR